jgi:hypothetical protein
MKKIGLILLSLCLVVFAYADSNYAYATVTTNATSVTSDGALTFTGAAASTWSTSAGALTIDSAAGLNLGTTNATGLTIGKSGVTTTVGGPLTVSTGGLTVSAGGAAITGNSTITGALTVTGAFSQASSALTATTNQLVLGTTNTVTITSPAPAASRTYTIPDNATASVNFVLAPTSTTATQALFATATSGAPAFRAVASADLPAALASQTSINGLAITASTGTLAITNAKTLSASNTLTLAGTDGTTMTFPTTSATIARTDAANTFTGVQTMTSAALTTPVIAGGLTASGSGSNDFSASTGTFKTSTGLVTVGGAATFSAAGTALTVTNNALISGNLTISGAFSPASLTVTAGNGLDAATSGALTLGPSVATSVQLGGSAVTAITTTTTTGGTIVLGNTAGTGQITLGSSTAAQTVVIGNGVNTGAQIVSIANGATAANSTVNILSGVGTAGAGSLLMADNTRVTQIDIGNIAAAAARTTTIGGGNNGVVDTINIGNGNGTVAGAETINIGAGTPTGSGTNLITIGSTAALADTLTLEAGTGTSMIIGNSANARTWNVGAGNAIQTVNLFNNASPANVISLGGAASSFTLGSVKNTLGIAGTANGNGVRIGASRVITANKPTAPIDCAAGNLTPSVTQMFEAGIFTCATAQSLTLPTAQGASGLVQALPGTPAVGDTFTFVMAENHATNAFTLVAGTGATIYGIATNTNGNRVWTCRVTSVTGGSETITCY